MNFEKFEEASKVISNIKTLNKLKDQLLSVYYTHHTNEIQEHMDKICKTFDECVKQEEEKFEKI